MPLTYAGTLLLPVPKLSGDEIDEITVDNVADGSGTATITFEEAGGGTNFGEIDLADVPANHLVDIKILYTAVGDMSNANNAFVADADLVSLRLTIPAEFPAPDEDASSGENRFISVTGSGLNSDWVRADHLEIFGHEVRVKNVLAAEDSEIEIDYTDVITPRYIGRSSRIPHRNSRQRQARDSDRSLQPLGTDKSSPDPEKNEISPQVTIGPVLSGSGSAKIVDPPVTGDPKLHRIIGGTKDVMIKFEFTTPGALDRLAEDKPSEVRFIVPFGWPEPNEDVRWGIPRSFPRQVFKLIRLGLSRVIGQLSFRL